MQLFGRQNHTPNFILAAANTRSLVIEGSIPKNPLAAVANRGITAIIGETLSNSGNSKSR